jgi:hypothetical protein
MLRLISIIIFILILSQSQLPGQNSKYKVLVIRNEITGTPEMILNDVLSLGYVSVLRDAVAIDEEYLNEYHAVIYSCGRNPNPYIYPVLGYALINYTMNRRGGIIVEGGDIAYSAITNQFFGFCEKILKISNWNGHGGENLTINNDYLSSPLVTYPNEISTTLDLNYQLETDQDITTPIELAQLLFSPQNNSSRAGILVFPRENIANPWVVNLFFNYAALTDRANAKNMLENFLYHVIQNTVSIDPISQNIPANFKLHQNFPNPFNPDTKIRFDVPRSSPVRLEIFDATGRLIDIPLDRFMQPGEYELIFPGNKNIDLSSGIYFYMIKADGIVDCKKMILLR